VLAARPKKRPTPPHRIASWNIRWFPDGAARGPGEHATDLAWLACAIAALEVQVVAVQEIVQHPRGRAALLDLLDLLDRRTGGKWRHALDDCPGSGRQHVGLLWDGSRVEVTAPHEIAALNPGDHACGKNLRPGYGAHIRFEDGVDFHVVSVHLDSGTSARDHGNRRTSLARLAGSLNALAESGDSDVLVLGDLNTMGCEDCVPVVTAAEEVAALDASAEAAGARRLDADGLCTEYHGSRPALLDHVLARGPALLAPEARVELHGACRDLGCRPLRRGERPASLQRLSDHCPLVVEVASPR
jgi:endonuclease/exonuclease/phosphatase family metal-dependent hydrolase